MKKLIVAFALMMFVTVLTGCPDRSYMRPVPDYSQHGDPPGFDESGNSDDEEEDQEPRDLGLGEEDEE